MDPRICIVCTQKNNSATINQAQAIQRIVGRVGLKEARNKNFSQNDEMSFVQAMTMFSRDHCEYGLYCTILNDRNSKYNNLIKSMAADVLAYVETLDYSGLCNFLRYFQGYFPSGYKWIERYWHSLGKKK